MNELVTMIADGGTVVHFADGTNATPQHEGVIVAAWLESQNLGDESTIRVTVQCKDNRYRDVWLSNCIKGRIPEPDLEVALDTGDSQPPRRTPKKPEVR